jgi:queuine tRNA-ribosyltransferase
MTRLGFVLEKTAPGSRARAARFRTAHGEVLTPVFMPVGTQATVKNMTADGLREIGAQVLLANTYHLLLRPGPEVFRKFGGIHRFMRWDRPVLTDSGGFQIFSLPEARAMREDGAEFRSYVDGELHRLSPESSIAMQQAIGSDIMMVLDQCIPGTAPHSEARAAMELTHRWALRSLRARGDDSPQALFGIVQGACHRDLRLRSAEFLRELPFDGLAIGGLAVGETAAQRQEFTEIAAAELPPDRPRYLMGVGTPIDILEAVHRGVDMFDCIIPTQLAQRGTAFTSHGRIHCRRAVYKFAEEPLDARCACKTCRDYSRAYLHHLVKADEPLGAHLLAHHNLAFYQRLMAEMRAAILGGDFAAYHERQRGQLGLDDEVSPPPRVTPPPARRAPRRGDYEIHPSPCGAFNSIRQISSGEVMHSVSAPAEEAERLYVAQSRLAERLRGDEPGSPTVPPAATPLVVWDVGLGAASNAMAAIACAERVRAAANATGVRPRPLRLVSFERDLDPLALAVRYASHFPHLRHAAPPALLRDGRWRDAEGLVEWELRHGDFLTEFEASAAPGLIFHDPFSAKTDTGLWTAEVFARMRRHCLAASGGPRPAELYTYSAATAVRVALLRAGWWVAEGVGTGPKTNTTVAYADAPGAEATARLLGAEWLARWRRSGARFPSDLPEAGRAAFAQGIEDHPQFIRA